MKTVSILALCIATSMVFVAESQAAPGPSKAKAQQQTIGTQKTETGKAKAAPQNQPADDYFEQGVKAYESGNWTAAEAAFLKAWELRRTHDTAANLGVVELKLGKAREAAEHLNFALKNSPPSDSNARRATVHKHLQEAQKLIGTLTVNVNIDGALILLDGKPVGQSPLSEEIFLVEGSHTVEAQKRGFIHAREVTTVAKGQASTLSLTLRAQERPGSKESGPSPAWIYAGAGATLAALGVGIGFAVASNSSADDADEIHAALSSGGVAACKAPSAECSKLMDALKSKDDTATVSAIGFTAASVFALGTAAAILWPRSQASEERRTSHANWTPWVSPRGGGIVVRGAFSGPF